jgi:molecular chaperone GrpE
MAKQATGEERRRRAAVKQGADTDQGELLERPSESDPDDPVHGVTAERVEVDGIGSAAESDPAARADQLAAETEQLKAQVAELQGDLLRKQADFENFRKRVNRDKEDAIRFANTSLLLDLTAVIDDFDRAITAGAQAQDFATLHSGIELIEKQFLQTLERKWGLVRFESAGAPFDPERHEALATEESAGHTQATVLEDYQKGYALHGRVVRAARVRVATPAARSTADPAGAADPGDSDQGE